MQPETIETQFQRMLEEFGRTLKVEAAVVAAYAAERTEHLSLIVDEPGFGEAVLAERDNVLLRAGIAATRSADVVDQRLAGLIQGALRMGAVALAAG